MLVLVEMSVLGVCIIALIQSEKISLWSGNIDKLDGICIFCAIKGVFQQNDVGICHRIWPSILNFGQNVLVDVICFGSVFVSLF